MIELTKLNGDKLVINSDLIEFVEALPDRLITLTTGKKIMVREEIPEIIAAIVEFRQRISQGRVVPAKPARSKPKGGSSDRTRAGTATDGD